MMFKMGEVVVYGAQGICKIDCIQTKQIGKQSADYYVLKPLFNENTSVFVPVDNKILTAKVQSVLSLEQAKILIESVPQIGILKFENENQKREQYKNIIAGGNREALIALIKTIFAERDVRRNTGKKLNINDEQMLRKAEALIYNELAFVYGVEPSEAKAIIKF